MVLATDEVYTYAIFNYINLVWSSHTEAGGKIFACQFTSTYMCAKLIDSPLGCHLNDHLIPIALKSFWIFPRVTIMVDESFTGLSPS